MVRRKAGVLRNLRPLRMGRAQADRGLAARAAGKTPVRDGDLCASAALYNQATGKRKFIFFSGSNAFRRPQCSSYFNKPLGAEPRQHGPLPQQKGAG